MSAMTQLVEMEMLYANILCPPSILIYIVESKTLQLEIWTCTLVNTYHGHSALPTESCTEWPFSTANT
jgi:hypothetical protein